MRQQQKQRRRLGQIHWRMMGILLACALLVYALLVLGRVQGWWMREEGSAGRLSVTGHVHDNPMTDDMERGSHGGRLFRDGDFALEVRVFEQGVPPEFRVYAYQDDALLPPEQVEVTITLTRLDGEVNRYRFHPLDEALQGEGVVAEPHSFDMQVQATYDGETYQWQVASYEGRTRIAPDVAEAQGLQTAVAAPARLQQWLPLLGQVQWNPQAMVELGARFPGIITDVEVTLGQHVRKGQPLLRVESNDSLRSYAITAPMDGVMTELKAQVGEVVGNEPVIVMADTTRLWVMLPVFATDQARVRPGMPVRLRPVGTKPVDAVEEEQSIAYFLPEVDADSQSRMAVVALPNPDGIWQPGMRVQAEVLLAEREVPLAVRTEALQRFRDFTVVFAQVGETYEVRMLETGEQDAEWTEVLGGLKPGTRYVVQNSYLLKADIEKSGASHDH